MATFDQVQKDLKAGTYQPVYFLHGNEPYFIDTISDYIEQQILNEGEKAFNLTILYGKEVDHKNVVDAARRYPMMAQRQVVVLKEAQEMKTLKDLQGYIENPATTTILAICYKHKKFNFNSGFGKALKKHTEVVEGKKIYDNQAADWVEKLLKTKKLKIEPQAAELMAEYLGTDLSKLSNEAEKLAINLPAGTMINVGHIEENIGISREYNVFELQKALGQRNVAKVARILQYIEQNPKKSPPPMVIGSLYNYFSKMYILHFMKNKPEADQLKALKLRSNFFLREYRQAIVKFNRAETEEVIHLLQEFDLRSKGLGFNISGREGELLKELIWRILHCRVGAVSAKK